MWFPREVVKLQDRRAHLQLLYTNVVNYKLLACSYFVNWFDKTLSMSGYDKEV